MSFSVYQSSEIKRLFWHPTKFSFYYYYRLNDLSSDDVFVVVVVGILLMMISFVAICMQLTKGSSVNDVTVSGRGSMFLRRQTKALLIQKRHDGERGLKNCPKFCDVIYGRPIKVI